MNHRSLVFSLALLWVCCAVGHAQEGGTPIKVTTAIHSDGTRTDTVKDIDNRTTETKTYSASQKLLERCVYTLDEQGREVEGVVYNAKDVIVSRVSLQYDAQGNISEQVEKTPNGMVKRRLVFIRVANGCVTVKTFDAKGTLIHEETSIIAPPPKKSSGKK
ncbi:MAG: hypothetical protein WCO68_04270 [Verrucomicrobiota bacterium]